MKWCVLQASLGDGWPPERFEALCKGTDPFLGKILFHSVEDNGESDLHWLLKLENGKLGGAACLVTSNRKIMETSALPIIYLNKLLCWKIQAAPMNLAKMAPRMYSKVWWQRTL